MIIIKHVPNIITLIRIICSILLFNCKPFSGLFLLIYFICGLSDVLDGFIARNFNCVSQIGATLDSIADFIFIFSMIIIIFPIFKWSWWMLVWIGIIILMRLISLLIGFVKYKTIAFWHTYSNKMTGFLLFLFLFLFFNNITNLNIIVCFLCGLATFSAIEEIFINIISTKLLRDVRSVFLIER